MKCIRPHACRTLVNRVTGSLFAYQGWPTLAQDENGTLYAVASGFRIRHVCPFGKTVMYVSRDGGKSWTPPVVINDTYLDDRDAGLVYLGEGKLLLSWFTRSPEEYCGPKHHELMALAPPAGQLAMKQMTEAVKLLPEEDRKIGSYVRLSRDYGVTWEEPVSIPITAPHGPTVCKDGSLIYLGTEHKAVGVPGTTRTKLFRSCDLGKSWQEVATLSKPAWLQPGESICEPHVLELADGSLLGAVRVQGRTPFTIATAVSKDGGKSWSEWVCTDADGAPPHLMCHSSGALICTYGRREVPYGERAMVSYDMGATWTEEYILDDDTDSRDLGYGSTVELADGSLLTLYYQRYPGDNYTSIFCTNWRLGDPAEK